MESHPINLWMHVEPMFRVLDKKITILQNYSYPFPKNLDLLDGPIQVFVLFEWGFLQCYLLN